MVTIVKQKIKAYILLESLVALAILSFIVSLVLTAINQQRQQLANYRQQEEVLNLATMAVQTNQTNLALNGVEVRIVQQTNGLAIISGGREIEAVVKK